ncbi:MAG: hypothetical protein ACOCXQ_03970 [Patescibacteria group bacterium]
MKYLSISIIGLLFVFITSFSVSAQNSLNVEDVIRRVPQENGRPIVSPEERRRPIRNGDDMRQKRLDRRDGMQDQQNNARETIQDARENSQDRKDQMQEGREDRLDSLCERFTTRIDQIITRYDANHNRNVQRYERLIKRLQKLDEIFTGRGYDTNELQTAIEGLNERVTQVNESYGIFITELRDTQDFECGESDGSFQEAAEESRQQLQVIREQVQEVRRYYLTTVRPAIISLREEVAAQNTGVGEDREEESNLPVTTNDNEK